MKNTILYNLIIISFFSLNIYSQKTVAIPADNKQDNFTNIDAMKTYERVAVKGYKSIDMFKKLGNTFYFNGELDKAVIWYTELFAMTSALDSEYYYRYSHSLRFIGEKNKADEILIKFNQLLEAESTSKNLNLR